MSFLEPSALGNIARIGAFSAKKWIWEKAPGRDSCKKIGPPCFFKWGFFFWVHFSERGRSKRRQGYLRLQKGEEKEKKRVKKKSLLKGRGLSKFQREEERWFRKWGLRFYLILFFFLPKIKGLLWFFKKSGMEENRKGRRGFVWGNREPPCFCVPCVVH